MEFQCGVPYSSQHSTTVNSSADVAAIATRLINEEAFHFERGRDGPVYKDLFQEGQMALAGMQPLLKYIAYIKKHFGTMDNGIEDETEVDSGDESSLTDEDSDSDDDDVEDALSEEGGRMA